MCDVVFGLKDVIITSNSGDLWVVRWKKCLCLFQGNSCPGFILLKLK